MESLREKLSNGNTYSKLILIIGILTAVPLISILFFPEEMYYASSFAIPASLLIILGLLTCILIPQPKDKMLEWKSPLQKGSLPVLVTWGIAFVTGAIPYIHSGILDFLPALFESVSGWTTAGFSVVELKSLPRIFLFYRSFMQYCGGLGFIIMLSMLVHGKQYTNLYSAESHPDRIMPSLRKTAQVIFLLYGSFLVIGTVLYRIFGMKWFDAICHGMTAISTAGFTTRAGSIGYFNSIGIEVVTIILMLIGATNFAVILLFVRRDFKKAISITEFRFMLMLVAIFVVVVTISFIVQMDLSPAESIRAAFFSVVTAMSTTGYQTMEYVALPSFAAGIFILLMICGGSAGSTSGGLKLIRIYLLLRIAFENVQSRLTPARKIAISSFTRVQGKNVIDDKVIKDTVGFFTSYLLIFILGTLLLTLTADCTIQQAMFEFASSLSTVGITNGITNPDTANSTLVVLMGGMILGRLEIFIVLIGIYSIFKSIQKGIFKTTSFFFRSRKQQ